MQENHYKEELKPKMLCHALPHNCYNTKPPQSELSSGVFVNHI